jgi:GntR family transcriptional regulator, transcriptional repressor for pyruvate dehydrogenase complex
MPFELKAHQEHPSRLSDWVKDLLKQAVWQGDLKPGERLPVEKEIARKLKVSKVTVREALREMESEGLIEKRRGMYGGSFVAEPSLSKMLDQVTNYYHTGGITLQELVEFRRILEPTLVAMAAERRTEEDLEKIRENMAAFEQSLDAGEMDHALAIEFHRLIADACHNPLVSAVMAALAGVFAEILDQVPMRVEDARIDLDYCKKFYDCLVHGRKEKARRLMQEHFDTLETIVREGPAFKGAAERLTTASGPEGVETGSGGTP